MEELSKGTIEFLRVAVKDRLGGLNDLTGTAPKFDVFNPAGTKIQDQVVATFVGMDVYCLVNTTLAGATYGIHRLYVNFQIAPEFPRLGPFEYKVVE